MPATLILRFAGTRRWAMVVSATRKARAISGVVRPPRVQSVSATTKASWTASSATSKSPVRRMRVATARPRSSRNRRSTTPCSCLSGGDVKDGTDLDRPVLGPGDLRGPLDGLVQVLAGEDVEAAELLLRLGEGPVGRGNLAVTHPHGRRRRGGLEPVAGVEDSGAAHGFRVLAVFLHHLLALFGGPLGPPILLTVDERHVPWHCPLPSLDLRRRSAPSP